MPQEINNQEQILEVTMPPNHEMSSRVPGAPKANGDVFRTKLAVQLKQEFGTDLYALRETNFAGSLTYRFAVRAKRVEEFRQRVAALGLDATELH